MVDFSLIQSMCMNKSHPNNLKQFTPDYFILIRYNYERCLEHTTCALGPPPPTPEYSPQNPELFFHYLILIIRY